MTETRGDSDVGNATGNTAALSTRVLLSGLLLVRYGSKSAVLTERRGVDAALLHMQAAAISPALGRGY